GPAIQISTRRLDAAKSGSPQVGDLMARYADALIAQLMQNITCTAIHPVEARVCRWLLFAHDRAMDDSVRLPQEGLAQRLGVPRTTVNGVIGALEARRLLRRRRGRVEIIDRHGLERAACECHAAVRRHEERVLPEIRQATPA